MTLTRLPCWALTALAVALASCGAKPAHPPIVLISIDTLRRDHVGLYGYERDTTPVLDRMAEESLVFEQAYTTMSFTLIAHMSLLTGLYPSQHGVINERTSLASAVPTLAERLQREGYYNMGFYFPGWLDGRYGFDRGFDVYLPHQTAAEADEHIAEALAERPDDQPLFLFVHLFDVHNTDLERPGATMYEPPEPFDRIFLEDAPERLADADVRELWYDDSSAVTAEQHEAIVALYDGGIRYVDDLLGQWFERWREQGWFDDAWIIVTSDHGEGLNQRRGRYGGHGNVQEEGLAVPLLVRKPGGADGGARIPWRVSHVDVLPSVLEVLGLETDERLVGQSLFEPGSDERIIYAERPKQADAYLRGSHKVVRQASGGTLFYDLEADPKEGRPRRKHAEEFDDVVVPLLEAVDAERATWFRPQAVAQTSQTDAELQAQLRALGYAGEFEEDGDAEPEAEAARDWASLRERMGGDDAEVMRKRVQRELALDPDSGELHALLSIAHRESGAVDEAVDAGKRAVELAPDASWVHHEYARALAMKMLEGGVLAAMGNLGEYKDEMQKAVDLDPGNVDALSEQIGFYLFAPGIVGGSTEKALELARQLEAHDRRMGKWLQAEAHWRNDDKERAKTVCRNALAEFPGDPDLCVSLASFLEEEGDPEAADQQYTVALASEKRTDGYWRALYESAKLRIENEFELDVAIERLNAYIEGDPRSNLLPPVAGAHWRIGLAQLARGDEPAARAAFEAALEADPEFERAQDALDELE